VRTAEPVVITGIGPVTPIGIGVDDYWSGLVKGRSGARAVTWLEVSDLPVKIAAPVDIDVHAYLAPEVARRMDRTSQLSVIAAALARDDAGLGPHDIDAERLAVVMASGMGGFSTLESALYRAWERGPGKVRPDALGMMLPNAPAGAVGMIQGALGPTECMATACASGAHAVQRAVNLLDAGHADVVLAGGAEAAITRAGIGSFAAARALSTRNDAPELASRPFDVDRDGFVLAEGATVLVLERLSDAKARGARVYATVAGLGGSGDAYHYMAPHPEGKGAELSMRNALRDAGLDPADVVHVNAHATSTPPGDLSEAKAILRLFPADVAVYAPKSSLGHLLGGAGTTELAASALSVCTGTLPGTLNTERQESAFALNVVPTTQEIGEGGSALCNSFGFGGTNASIVLT
jgi:3-oxoacyl-[acyl-carrier-protein] synthase II